MLKVTVVDTPRTKLQPRPIRVARKLRVRVTRGPDAGAELAPDDQAEDRIAIGTAADNALVLADPAVSRYHLEVVRDAGGLHVIDLGSRNGTWVGDVRIERAIVPPGATI